MRCVVLEEGVPSTKKMAALSRGSTPPSRLSFPRALVFPPGTSAFVLPGLNFTLGGGLGQRLYRSRIWREYAFVSVVPNGSLLGGVFRLGCGPLPFFLFKPRSPPGLPVPMSESYGINQPMPGDAPSSVATLMFAVALLAPFALIAMAALAGFYYGSKR